MGVILYLPTLGLMLFLAHVMYGMALPGNLFSLFLFVCFGAAAFRALGLIIASVVNSSQEANVLIQIVYMSLSIPTTSAPSFAKRFTVSDPINPAEPVTIITGILIAR